MYPEELQELFERLDINSLYLYAKLVILVSLTQYHILINSMEQSP